MFHLSTTFSICTLSRILDQSSLMCPVILLLVLTLHCPHCLIGAGALQNEALGLQLITQWQFMDLYGFKQRITTFNNLKYGCDEHSWLVEPEMCVCQLPEFFTFSMRTPHYTSLSSLLIFVMFSFALLLYILYIPYDILLFWLKQLHFQKI